MSSAPSSGAEATAGPPRNERRAFLTNRRVIGLVVAAVLFTLLTVFIADNFVLVEVRLMGLRIRARLAWVMVVPLLLGATLAWLTCWFAFAHPSRRHSGRS